MKSGIESSRDELVIRVKTTPTWKQSPSLPPLLEEHDLTVDLRFIDTMIIEFGVERRKVEPKVGLNFTTDLDHLRALYSTV